MKDPHIVFCSKNHIYDASLHAECPYCRRIAAEQNALIKSLSGSSTQKRIVNNDDEQTEQIGDGAAAERDREEHNTQGEPYRGNRSELIRHEKEEKKDRTEHPAKQLHGEGYPDSSERRRSSAVGPVLGWLVCSSGRMKGRSFEISFGMNRVLINKDALWVSADDAKTGKELAKITQVNRRFLLEPGKSVHCQVNGGETGNTELRNYDVIVLDENEFVFVELTTAFVDWGI